MIEEITKSTKLSSAPSLSPSLTTLYQTLNVNDRRLFVKIYRYLWGVVAPASRFVRSYGLLYSYWALDLLRVRADLTTTELSLLSYLYQVTNKGRKYIHTAAIYNSAVLPGLVEHTKCCRITDLVRRGFIIRNWRDPIANKYTSRYFGWRSPVFICLTPSGVALVENIEKDLYKLLLSTSLDDITGRNKKAPTA